MKNYNKKPLIALALVLIGGLVGGTLAYFTKEISIENKFKTKPYGTEITEEFESPENWTPGTTTAKTVVAKNTGDVDMAVRVSYEDKWLSANGKELSGKQGSETAAIINFANTSDWIKDGDFYYYNKKLTKGQTTSSFISSVTFNSKITPDLDCTPENVMPQSCKSSGNGYDGATYTLTVKVETIQFDAYKTQWPTNVSIS